MAPGVAQGGEHQDRGPLGHDVSLGRVVEDPALAVADQPEALEGQQGAGQQVAVHPAGDHRLVVAGLQAAHRQVHGHCGRGARGVHGEVGPVAAEVLAHPGGDDVGKQAGNGVLGVGQIPGAHPFAQGLGHRRGARRVHILHPAQDALQQGNAGAQDVFDVLFPGQGPQDDRHAVSGFEPVGQSPAAVMAWPAASRANCWARSIDRAAAGGVLKRAWSKR